ncbi:MAG: preprotein translocase subunit YajC [Clostridia bacterium]|nr:preprotein translocase subunit YajC [Clostridia bacterium]
MIALVFVFFYFFMIRPQKKQEKKDSEMRDALAVGDEVTTIGGIIGKVVSIKGETFVLETTKDKTKIRFLRGAIRSVDVKAADIAAAVIESKDAEAAEAETKDANETAEAVETVETVETAAEVDAATEEKKDEN